MDGGIHPAAVEVEPDGARHRLGEDALAVDRDSRAAGPNRVPRRPLDETCCTSGTSSRRRSAKSAADLRRGHARLVVLQQGVVRGLRVADRLGLLPRERDLALEPGAEPLVVRALPRVGPGPLGQGGHPGTLLDQPPGEAPLAVVLAAQLADVDRDRGSGSATRSEASSSSSSSPTRGSVLRSCSRPARSPSCSLRWVDAGAREAGLLVPLQHVHARREGRFLARESDQLVIGCFGLHRRNKIAGPGTLEEGMDQNTVEAEGLRRTRLAARVRQALYHVPADELARAHERMREASLERHLDYFMDGEVNTIRVLPLPITILPEQVRVPAHDRPHAPPRAPSDAGALSLRSRRARAAPAGAGGGRMAPRLLDAGGTGPQPGLRPAGRTGGLLQSRLEGDAPVRGAQPDRHRRAASRPSVEEVVDGTIVPLLAGAGLGRSGSPVSPDARELLLGVSLRAPRGHRPARRAGVLHRAQVRAGGHRRAAPAGRVLSPPPWTRDAPCRPARAETRGRRGLLRRRPGGPGVSRLQRARPGRAGGRRAWTCRRCGPCSGRTGSSPPSPRSWTTRAAGRC